MTIKRSLINIDISLQIPVYKQIIQEIEYLVDADVYKKGDYLPSLNELALELNISKETVKKAYSILRKQRIIDSVQGKGFYILNKEKSKTKILLVFDKLSTYKYVLYSSFALKLGNSYEIVIRLHNQDIELFEHFIEENLDSFDYYVITPHFTLQPANEKRVIKTLKKIPNRKLILLDRFFSNLHGNFGAVYQDFENDIYEGLMQGLNDIKKFKKINVITRPGSLYAPLLKKGIKNFCEENNMPYIIHKNIDVKNISKHEMFLILNSQLDIELIELSKIANAKGFQVGKDVCIISYNESPINEIVLNGLTVLSTDFKRMGELAAEMIIKKSFKKIKCDFKLIRRKTF